MPFTARECRSLRGDTAPQAVHGTLVPMSLRECLQQFCLILVPWLLFVVLNDFRRPRD
jgi:hypothetical protein